MNGVIRKIGNSAGTILPYDLLKKAKLKVGDRIVISEQDNALHIKKATDRPSYTLDELLGQCDMDGPEVDELCVWNNLSLGGKEGFEL